MLLSGGEQRADNTELSSHTSSGFCYCFFFFLATWKTSEQNQEMWTWSKSRHGSKLQFLAKSGGWLLAFGAFLTSTRARPSLLVGTSLPACVDSSWQESWELLPSCSDHWRPNSLSKSQKCNWIFDIWNGLTSLFFFLITRLKNLKEWKFLDFLVRFSTAMLMVLKNASSPP